jgi:hypothetical protein
MIVASRANGWLAILALSCASIGCGGTSATSPSRGAPPFADGSFMLQLMGDGIKCGDATSPFVGTSVNAMAVGTHDDQGTWIGRAASADDGTFEIRLSRTPTAAASPSGSAHGTDFYVTGTVSGTALDSVKFVAQQPASGRSASLGAGAAISGIVHTSVRFGDGYVGVAINFSRAGSSISCPSGTATWYVGGANPVPGASARN